jgi:hypothetical protein
VQGRLGLLQGFPSELASRIVASPTASPVLTEQFRRLAAALHHSQLVQGTKVVMVTSANPADGKSLTAANLATGPDLRVCQLAALLLDHLEWRYEEGQCAAFLEGVLRTCDLRLDEIWAVRTALQFCLLERLVSVVTTGGSALG